MEKANGSRQIFQLSPEPLGIYTLPIETHLKYKNKLIWILENAPSSLKQKFKGEDYSEHVCNSAYQNIFDEFPELEELKSNLKLMIKDYIQEIGYVCNEIIINDAWLNNARKNAQLETHSHSNSYISGNYFINFDIAKHSPLAFINDRFYSKFNAPSISLNENKAKPTIYNTSYTTLNCREGQVFLWHSHVRHGYKIPNKEDNRYTLSFNCMPKTCMTGDRYSFQVADKKYAT